MKPRGRTPSSYNIFDRGIKMIYGKIEIKAQDKEDAVELIQLLHDFAARHGIEVAGCIGDEDDIDVCKNWDSVLLKDEPQPDEDEDEEEKKEELRRQLYDLLEQIL